MNPIISTCFLFDSIFIGKDLGQHRNASHESIVKTVTSEDKRAWIETASHASDNDRQNSGLENVEFVKNQRDNGLTRNGNEAKYYRDNHYSHGTENPGDGDDPDKGSRTYDNYDNLDVIGNNDDDNDYPNYKVNAGYDDDHDNNYPNDIEDESYDDNDYNDYRNKEDYDNDDDDKENDEKAWHTINAIKNYNKGLPINHGVGIAETYLEAL